MSAPLDLNEAAAYLHVARRTMYRYVKERRVASSKPAGKRLFLTEDLDAFARGNRRASQAELNEQADEILAARVPSRSA